MPCCLSCSNNLLIAEDTIVGEILECNNCGQEHEVIKSDDGSLTISYAPEVEEDWGE